MEYNDLDFQFIVIYDCNFCLIDEYMFFSFTSFKYNCLSEKYAWHGFVYEGLALNE